MNNLTQLRKAMHEVENLERLESSIAEVLGDPEDAPRNPGDGNPSPGGDRPADPTPGQPTEPAPSNPAPGGDNPSPASDTPARAAMTFEFPGRPGGDLYYRPAPTPSLGAIVADLDRAYYAQRAKVRDLETEHAVAMAQLESGFKRKAEDLMHEANEAMRALDLKHEKAIAAETATLDALKKLRG